MILAIDPGTERSAYVVYCPESHAVLEKDIEPNHWLYERLRYAAATSCVIEMVASYGMPVGREVFDTVAWIGRFEAACFAREGHWPERIFRQQVKLHLCGNVRAKDSNIRQALIDLFPATGGGKKPQIGTKSKPGPLYGMASDMWSALGVAITAAAAVPSSEAR